VVRLQVDGRPVTGDLVPLPARADGTIVVEAFVEAPADAGVAPGDAAAGSR